MEPELTNQVARIISAAIPTIIIFAVGVIVATSLQEWVRSHWRNGRGNRRNGDGDDRWPDQMLVLFGGMNTKLDDIKKVLQNGFSTDLRAIREELQRLRRD